MKNNLIQKCTAEFIGTFALVFFGCGSMILYEINPNEILIDSIPIIFGLIIAVMIYSLGHISGAHFNPVVTMAMYLTKKIKKNLIIIYISAQISGCLLGVMLANFMFELPVIELSQKVRPGINIFIAEIIATFGLIFIIFGSLKNGTVAVAASVATYITAGYWFTSSTSFANPAVALARTFTDTFTGINYLNTPTYIVAEILGALLALFIIQRIFFKK